MGEPGNREAGRASSNGMTLSGSMVDGYSLEMVEQDACRAGGQNKDPGK